MTPRPSTRRSTGLVAGAYLVLALLVLAPIWATHPSATSLCGCGDPAYSLWFMGFAAHAASHGASPLWTALQWHPVGVNVLDGATQLGLGIPLAPVSWAWGSVAALNVALALAPALSALGMYVLACRWVRWRPAAFVAGLLYGFSPFVLMNLAQAHLVVAMLVAPPLVVACLDELVVAQRRRPIRVGLVLGALVVWQFFVSLEVLLMTAVVVVAGLVVVGALALRRGAAPERRRHALVGLATATAVALVALAWPTWFALAGPAHVSGTYYPSAQLAATGARLRWLLVPTAPLEALSALAHRFGGYQGPTVPAEFVGPGIPLVVLGGLVAFRRDRRLWSAVAVGALGLVLALGAGPLRPWGLLEHLPLARNVVPVRFLVVAMGGLAAAVAVVLDRTVAAASARWPGRGPVVGLALAAVALLPIVVDLAPVLPLAGEPVAVPTWFRTPHRLGAHPVVLPIPVAFSAIQSALAWQSVPGFRFAMAGGDGPGSDLALAGRHRAAQAALMAVSGVFPAPALERGSAPAVAAALRDWRVTTVVLPLDGSLPPYDRAAAPAAAAALLTSATGRLPVRTDEALVWQVEPGRAPTALGRGRLDRCTVEGGRDPMGAARCALGLGRRAGLSAGGAT